MSAGEERPSKRALESSPDDPTLKKTKVSSSHPTEVAQANGNSRERRKKRLLSQNIVPSLDKYQIPRTLDLEEFASSHLREMNDFTQSLNTTNTMRRVYQTVARHLRRRGMSHNVHRLPPKMRSAASREMLRMDSSKSSKTIVSNGNVTHKTRKTRRAPRSLLLDRISRSSSTTWLETHLWFARRFHMKKMWGYHIAHYANDKSTRALMGASRHLCTIHDASYHECIQISGSFEDIQRVVSPMLSVSGASQLSSSHFCAGSVEFASDFHYPQRFPMKPNASNTPWEAILQHGSYGELIGPVRVLWDTQSMQSSPSSPRSLWIWSHPSTSNVIQSLLFALKHYNDLASLEIASLAGHLNRFELRGPRASAVLKAALRVLSIPSSISDNNDPQSCVSSNNKYWDKISALRSPGCLPSGMVFAAQVTNPRAVISRQPFAKQERKTSQDITDDALTSLTSLAQKMQKSHIPSSVSSLEGLKSEPQKRKHKTISFDTSMSVSTKHIEYVGKLNDTQLDHTIPTDSALFSHSARCVLAENSPLGVKSARIGAKYIGNTCKGDHSKSSLSGANTTDHALSQRLYSSYTPKTQAEGFGYWFDEGIQSFATERTRAAVRLGHTKLPNLKGSLTTHIMLVQRPVTTINGLIETDGRPRTQGGGWDIILPAGWANAFFISFAHSGARPIGIRERRAFLAECGEQSFPQDYPDTMAGRIWSEHQVTQQRLCFYRRAKARVNFWKAKTDFPFGSGWYALCNAQRSMLQKSSVVESIEKYIENMTMTVSERIRLFHAKLQSPVVSPPEALFRGRIFESGRLKLGERNLKWKSKVLQVVKNKYKRQKMRLRMKEKAGSPQQPLGITKSISNDRDISEYFPYQVVTPTSFQDPSTLKISELLQHSLSSNPNAVPSQRILSKKSTNPDSELYSVPLFICSSNPRITFKLHAELVQAQQVNSQSVSFPFLMCAPSSSWRQLAVQKLTLVNSETEQSLGSDCQSISLPVHTILLRLKSPLSSPFSVARKWKNTFKVRDSIHHILNLSQYHGQQLNRHSPKFVDAFFHLMTQLKSSPVCVPEMLFGLKQSHWNELQESIATLRAGQPLSPQRVQYFAKSPIISTLISNLTVGIANIIDQVDINQFNSEQKVSFVPVTLELLGKGSPSDHSMISIPTIEQINEHFMLGGSKYGLPYLDTPRGDPWTVYLAGLKKFSSSSNPTMVDDPNTQLWSKESMRIAGFINFAQYSAASGRGGAQLGLMRQLDYSLLLLTVASGADWFDVATDLSNQSSMQQDNHDHDHDQPSDQTPMKECIANVSLSLQEENNQTFAAPTKVPVWIRKPGSLHHFPAWARVV